MMHDKRVGGWLGAGKKVFVAAGLVAGCSTPVDARSSSPAPGTSEDSALLASAGPRHPAAPRLLPCPPHVPEALNPPAQATLELALPASGVQRYVCSSAQPGAAPSWTLQGPHALLGSGKALVGIHYEGPTWQALDGSAVKGSKLASADAPSPDAVPWLLLSAAPTAPAAAPAASSAPAPAAAVSFARVNIVQRLGTVGGKAPATGCDAAHTGAQVLVPYSANYYFYRPASAGEAVHQCRSDAGKAKS